MRKGRWLFLLLASGIAHAASFDCAKALTAPEKAICSVPELSVADERLSASYKASIEGLLPDTIQALRSDESEWLHYVARVCEAGKKQPTKSLARCMLEPFQARNELLPKSRNRHGQTLFVMRTRFVTMPPSKNWSDKTSGTYNLQTFIWPYADSDAPEWKNWNAAVERAVMAEIGLPASDAAGEVTADVEYLGQARVTASIREQHIYEGFPHLYIHSEKFHWLLKENREMKVEDMFKPGIEWVKAVYDCCAVEGIKGHTYNDGDRDGAFARTLFEEFVKKPRNWDIGSGGLTFEFTEGALGEASDPEPLTVPWMTLQPFLQANFAIPK